MAEWSPGQASDRADRARRQRPALRQAGGRPRLAHATPRCRGPSGRACARSAAARARRAARDGGGAGRARPRPDRAPAQAHPAAVAGERAGHPARRHDRARADRRGRGRRAAPRVRLLPLRDRAHPRRRHGGLRGRPGRVLRAAGGQMVPAARRGADRALPARAAAGDRGRHGRHADSGDRRDRRSRARSSWCRCGSGTPCGGPSTSRRPARTPSTRTTPGWCRRWPIRPAPRCARPRSTSSSTRVRGHRGGAGRALEAKDSYTASHSRAVVGRALAVGERLGLTGDELRMLRFGGSSTTSARSRCRRRSSTSAGRSRPRSGPRSSATHPGRADPLDGGLPGAGAAAGPPRARALGRPRLPGRPGGEAIPLGSRIILACDAYDAMTSDRPYRAAMSRRQARAELIAGAGTSSTSGWWPRCSRCSRLTSAQAAVSAAR